MKKQIVFVLSTTLLVAGCVSPQSQNALNTLQAQCHAGNADSCTAAGFQAQANQQELSNNTAIATGIGAAIFAAAVVAQPVFIDDQPVTYFDGGYMVGGRRFAGRPPVQRVVVRQVAAGHAPESRKVFVH